MTRIVSNSRVMDLVLKREKNQLTLVDQVPESQFPGKRSAYYINGQYYGHDLSGFHPLGGTRMSIMKLVLPPEENPNDYWRITPDDKANDVLVIPEDATLGSPRIASHCNALPSWYEDKTEYRPTKFAPKFKLIENKINASYLKRSDTDWKDAIGRAGLTHVEAEHVPTDNLFAPSQASRYGLPSTHIFDAFGKKAGKDLTRDDVRQAAEGFGSLGLLGDQFGEGDLWFPGDSDQAYWFYEKAKEMSADPQCKWATVHFGGYGSFIFYNVRAWKSKDGNLVLDDESLTRFYKDPNATAQSCSYFNRMAQLIDANVSWYPQDFSYAQNLYQRIHSIQVLKLGQAQKAPDKKTYLFWWYGIENNDNGRIQNGYQWERETTEPPGKTMSGEHPVVDLNSAVGMCLLAGFVVGDGVIGWDNNIQWDPNPNIVSKEAPWTPSGEDKNVKRAERFGYPDSPVSILSAQFIASQWYQTCSRTEGAAWKYARYKVDNGTWVEPEADGSTILKLASQTDRNQKGIAFTRQRGKAVDWIFQNPMWLPDQQHTVTVEVGGKQWAQRIRGNEVVVCNETI